ncbi:MAG: hypothetical protein AB1753_06380 [Thermoproteota archaeon]
MLNEAAWITRLITVMMTAAVQAHGLPYSRSHVIANDAMPRAKANRLKGPE